MLLQYFKFIVSIKDKWHKRKKIHSTGLHHSTDGNSIARQFPNFGKSLWATLSHKLEAQLEFFLAKFPTQY